MRGPARFDARLDRDSGVLTFGRARDTLAMHIETQYQQKLPLVFLCLSKVAFFRLAVRGRSLSACTLSGGPVSTFSSSSLISAPPVHDNDDEYDPFLVCFFLSLLASCCCFEAYTILHSAAVRHIVWSSVQLAIHASKTCPQCPERVRAEGGLTF